MEIKKVLIILLKISLPSEDLWQKRSKKYDLRDQLIEDLKNIKINRILNVILNLI